MLILSSRGKGTTPSQELLFPEAKEPYATNVAWSNSGLIEVKSNYAISATQMPIRGAPKKVHEIATSLLVWAFTPWVQGRPPSSQPEEIA